jgi:hypothetical protein
MTVIERVNMIINSAISKEGEVYQALWGSEDFTPDTVRDDPNDYKCGAIANQLEWFYNEFYDVLTENNLAEMDGDYLAMVILFFINETRYSISESNAEFLQRLYSFTYRNGCTRWGTPWCDLEVIAYYTRNRTRLYYVNNYVGTNLIINGDFESAIGAEWVFSSGDRSANDSFTGIYKVDFTMDSLAQSVALTSGGHVFHCFAKGVGDLFDLVIQRASDSYYLNIETLVWEAVQPENMFSHTVDEWFLCEAFIPLESSDTVTITFVRENDFLLDRVELGLITYPSYMILFIDTGLAEGFASVWGTSTTYENASYHDQDFMFESGSTAIPDTEIQSVLDRIKPSGVYAKFKREARVTE